MLKWIVFSLGLFTGLACTKKKEPSQPKTEASTTAKPMDDIHQSYIRTEDGAMFEKPTLSPRDKMKMKEIAIKKKQYQKNTFDETQAMAIFLANCSRCHGNGGMGDGPESGKLPIAPTNLKEWDLKFGSDLDSLVYTISYGRSDNEMPGFRSILSEKEIWLVSQLVATWVQKN